MLLRRGTLPPSPSRASPLLNNGDHMSQAEFHRRYDQYPEDAKFELIKGTVYMASPQRRPHGKCEICVSTLLGIYLVETPGVEAMHSTTVILGDESEPQPDFVLRVLPEHGGATTTDNEYVRGAPEFVIEVAHSTVAIDLYDKKDDYERNGVGEYVVVCLEEQRVYWFDLCHSRTRNLRRDGILRSKAFPGLWIDTTALFRGDLKCLMRVLKKGLASPEHAQFAQRLQKTASDPKRARKNKKADKRTQNGGK